MRNSSGPPVPILFTVRELDQGGIERDVARVAMNLDRSRYEPHVASYFGHGMRYEELKRAGIPMLQLPVKSLVSPGTAYQALRLWNYIRKHHIQLVHCWDTSAVFVVPLAKLIGVPVVLSSLLGSRQLLDKRSRGQWRYTDRLVDAVIVNCEAMRRHLVEDEGASGVRIELCYNGVDTRQFHPLAAEQRPAEVADASLVIGAVCALRPEKALHLLQEAFAKIGQLRTGMKLLIVGSGAELSRLRENAARLGIDEVSVFVPATPNVPRYLRAIDIFVLCSLSEAFSNALLEAMACGCAPVGSRVGGTPEMLGEDERRGLLFPCGDALGLADQLERLIKDDAMRKSLGQQAAAFALQELSLEKNVNRTSGIYEDMLRGKV